MTPEFELAIGVAQLRDGLKMDAEFWWHTDKGDLRQLLRTSKARAYVDKPGGSERNADGIYETWNRRWASAYLAEFKKEDP